MRFEPMLYTENDLLYSAGEVLMTQRFRTENYSDALEQYLRSVGERNRIEQIFMLEQQLDDFLPLMSLWLVNNSSQESMLKAWDSDDDLIAGGDISYAATTISGAGTTYLDTGINPSIYIDDINNFSMGIISQTENNSGVDIGASETGTGQISIACRNSGSAEFYVGDMSVSGEVDDSVGHYILNAYSGTLTGYKGDNLDLTEIGNTSISGDIPGFNLIIGGLNDDGTPGSFAANGYSLIWLYNGSMDSNTIEFMHSILYNYDIIMGR